MINIEHAVDSLSNFKRRTSQYVKKMRKTGQPLVLTVNGKPSLVVQDPASYQKILDSVDQLRTLQAIRLGMKQAKEGKKLPLDEALAEIEKKLGWKK